MQSPTIGKITVALAAVQATLQPADKDGTNPHFNSKFATLASIWDACRKPLSDGKLAVTQGVDVNERGNIFWTLLMHESGEWIRSEMPFMLTKADPQGVGSAMTYYRRYGLAAMVGIIQDDDDGNAATGKPEAKAQTQRPPAAGAAKTEDPKDHAALLESAASEAALKLIWVKIYKMKAKFSAADFKMLEGLKGARKKEFEDAGK